MRNCRDTFLHFLADHSYLTGITVHNIRRDSNVPDAAFIQDNAVNVQFVNSDFGSLGHNSRQLVSIDVVHDDELTCLDWASKVASVLQTAGYTPKLDYSVTPPASLGTNIRWNPDLVRFRPITTGDSYSRMTCLLSLNHII
jgi:hypothetical protein